MKLSEKVRAAYDGCKLFPESRRNADGTFTVRGDAYVALIELRNLAPEIEVALLTQESVAPCVADPTHRDPAKPLDPRDSAT